MLEAGGKLQARIHFVTAASGGYLDSEHGVQARTGHQATAETYTRAFGGSLRVALN